MKAFSEKAIKIAGITAGAAVAASLSAYGTTKYLVNIALDREMPKTVRKAGKLISGEKNNRAFSEAREKASERLAAAPHETVEITAHDGEKLVGHFVPCENPKRVVIVVHGWRSSWHRDFGLVADFWKNRQCSVLYVEQRGQNNSGGEYMGFGLTERFDCLDWINWVIGRCGENIPIYLAGVSMGATTVLMSAGLDLPANVHGIMADCGFTSPRAIWKHIARRNLHIGFEIRGAIANAICKQKISVGTEDYSTTDALKASDIPVLLVHGANDHFVPVEMTYENYSACNAPKQLLIVPGADHGMSYFVEPEKYEAVAERFWEDHDQPAGSPQKSSGAEQNTLP